MTGCCISGWCCRCRSLLLGIDGRRRFVPVVIPCDVLLLYSDVPEHGICTGIGANLIYAEDSICGACYGSNLCRIFWSGSSRLWCGNLLFCTVCERGKTTILLGEDADFQGYSYIVNGMMKDKAMLLAIIAFVVIVMVTALIHQLNFDYAWYVAIGVGSVFTILVFMVCGMLVDVSVPAGSLVLGAILGVCLA